MHKLLERLDDSASTFVPVVYLVALSLGTAAYFSGVILDAGAAVGITLALAAEVHAFLEQRRVRASFAAWRIASQNAATGADRQPWHADAQLRLHGGILLALVAFSTYNSIAFTAATWRPSAGFLPPWLQIAVRGAVIPAFFLLTGALSPLHVDAGETLARAASDMLHTALKATTRQWRSRIKRARKDGLDLAPVAVALMLDAGNDAGARRVQLIADGLSAAEQRDGSRGLLALAPASLTYAASLPPVQFPAQPPAFPPAPAPQTSATAPTLEPAPEPTSARPARRKATTRATTRRYVPSGKTAGQGVSLEAQARVVWSDGVRTVNAMRAATGMSKNAASGWVRTLKAEQQTEKK